MTVGDSPTRRDALPKVDGTARYPGDRIPANALVAFAVALVLSKLCAIRRRRRR